MLKNFLRISVAAGVLLAAVLVSNAQSVNGSLGTVTKGKPQRATVYLSIPGGQHANSHNPNSEYAIATVVRASSTKGVKIGAVSYPRGRNRKFGFSENPINVYEGRVAFTFPLTVPQNFAGSSVRVNVSVRYQTCTDEVCYPPKTKSLTLSAAVR
ncbi:MAG TPA: protein-disulfide reductase DsbD N-terminal domain-containing protein [Pyrinomonadaceae bacterium]|nr:protein-disulfide reductase DsbD N-terminal domain-containing protein [Pyrinomonadaceae bacterium]